MGKLKRLIPALLAAIFAFAMIFTVACAVEPEGIDQNALIAITLNTTRAKTEYELGEEYTSNRLVVRVTMKDIDSGLETPVDVSDKATIDSSEYNANKVGTYDIYVSYSHAGVTRSTSYQVKVNASEPEFGGLIVEYAEGFENKQDLSYGTAGNPSTVTINPQLVVKKVQDDGTLSAALSANDYDVKLYRGTEEMSGWTVGGGAYSIKVSLKSDASVNNTVEYYVVDKFLTFKLANADEAVTQIDQWSGDNKINEMASTWKFTATYFSGVTKEVTVADKGVSYSLNVEESGVKNVAVKYTELNALNAEESNTATVPVTVNKIEADITDYNFSINVVKSTLDTVNSTPKPADNTPLTAECFKGVNSFLTFVEEGSSEKVEKYRTNNGGCIEIKGGRLQVTFSGKGYIIIGFSSNGGTNVSGMALLDKDGNYVYGSAVSGVQQLTEDDMDGNLAGLFTVTGTSEGKVKFSVEEAGTYTIYSSYSYSGGSRGCRLYSIEMKDVVVK